MALRPSSSSSAKRPWYLVAALIGGWIYGAQALTAGYEAIAFFRGDQVDVHKEADDIPDATMRELAIDAGERWLATKQAARSRELPVGVATLLLGAAMVLLSARSMAGREGARSALVQVVLVHAGLVIGGYFLTAAVARSDAEFHTRVVEGLTKGLDDPAIKARAEEVTGWLVRVGPPFQVVLQTVWSGLLVLALTRPRVRPFFFAPPPGPLGEG